MRKLCFAATAALLFLSMSFVPCSAFQLYPDGTFGTGNGSFLRPDGSFGTTPDFEMTPDGRFVDKR